MPSETESFSLDKYAFSLIENMLSNEIEDELKTSPAEEFLLNLKKKETLEQSKSLYFVENEDDYIVKNIIWPNIGDFNETIAAQKIEEFIKKTWEYDECWLYCIDFIDKVDQEFKCLYNFKARWSIPTRRRPIPRFTASVYFTFEISKIKPKDKPVDVYYVFETQKFVHKPGESRFRQEWLSDIIAFKENLIKDCKF